jgi:xanthine dehydrogenase iron-sulfur cluster and FAD-binding subunit A
VIFIGGMQRAATITVSDEAVTIGAGVSYSAFVPVLQEHFPHMEELWWRIGGEQVRNMGTLGGNIANGSPIGDTPPAFIALGATLTLRSKPARARCRWKIFSSPTASRTAARRVCRKPHPAEADPGVAQRRLQDFQAAR